MEQKKIAILYDFDQTLSIKSMEEYGLFDYLEIEPQALYDRVTVRAAEYEMDRVLAFMLELVVRAKEVNKPLTKKVLIDSGANIEYFPGVLSWFERINQFGKERGIEVEHYLVSSGISEIVEGSIIAGQFKRIYACHYVYDEQGNAVWPAKAINYTNKTQFIFRINKGVLDIVDDSINKVMQRELRPVPHENIVYIGDGFTDVPCMKVVESKGGTSIAVYGDNKKNSETLFNDKRVSAYCKADYCEGSELDRTIKQLIINMQINSTK